jgi:hypothetical protein
LGCFPHKDLKKERRNRRRERKKKRRDYINTNIYLPNSTSQHHSPLGNTGDIGMNL